MYLTSVAWKGWIPFDDGMLAQAAQRVLDGQLPHLDFDEVYTGALSFFHAAAFKLGGSSLGTLRAALLVVTTVSIPVWYYVAQRFVSSPLAAGIVTLAAFAWSVPNYPAAMPSWYNLILAIAATAAVLRYLDTRRRQWLLAAGTCAGLSILVKIVGLYLVAAITLFLAYTAVSPYGDRVDSASGGSRAEGWMLVLLCIAFTAAPFLLISAAPDLRGIFELAAPPALIAIAIAYRLVGAAGQGGHSLIRAVEVDFVAFGVGVLIPLLMFAGVYVRAGALPELLQSVFVSPRLRFAVATMHTPGGPPLSSFAFTLPIVLALGIRPGVRLDRGASVIVLAVSAAATLVSIVDHRVMVAVWLSVRMLVLPIVAIVVLRLVHDRAADAASGKRDAAVLLCCVAAWCSLGQFPFGAPIYFSYVAPLVILAAIALATDSGRPAPAIGLPLVLGYAAFAFAVRPQLFPRRPELSPLAERIDLPRGGIYVWPQERRQYTALASSLRDHAVGPWILALPDAPEVYFLSGYRNPTRAFYDVFEDSTGRTRRLLRLAELHDIRAVVINRDPQVSAPVDKSLDDSLVRRYPHSRTIGTFELRWR